MDRVERILLIAFLGLMAIFVIQWYVKKNTTTSIPVSNILTSMSPTGQELVGTHQLGPLRVSSKNQNIYLSPQNGQITFTWLSEKRGYYITTSLPYNKVKFEGIDNSQKPSVRFRWYSGDTTNITTIMEEKLQYAVFSIRECDWPRKE